MGTGSAKEGLTRPRFMELLFLSVNIVCLFVCLFVCLLVMLRIVEMVGIWGLQEIVDDTLSSMRPKQRHREFPFRHDLVRRSFKGGLMGILWL
jgi:Flp pilus assembly protein TadB